MKHVPEYEKSLSKESEQLICDIKWIKKKTDQLNHDVNNDDKEPNFTFGVRIDDFN